MYRVYQKYQELHTHQSRDACENTRDQWNQAIDHDSGLTKMSVTLACVSPANFKTIDPEQVLLHEQCYSERWDLFLNCRMRMCHHVRALSLLFVCSL